MDAIPFLAPIAGVAILSSFCWGCCLVRRVRGSEDKLRLLERRFADYVDAEESRKAAAAQKAKAQLQQLQQLPQQAPLAYPSMYGYSIPAFKPSTPVQPSAPPVAQPQFQYYYQQPLQQPQV